MLSSGPLTMDVEKVFVQVVHIFLTEISGTFHGEIDKLIGKNDG